MAKEKKPKDDSGKKRKGRPGLVDMACPRCGEKVKMRDAGEGCYSGECGDCGIEIEAVIASLGGKPSVELYPMGCDVPIPDEEDLIDIPPDDYGDYFPADDLPKEDR